MNTYDLSYYDFINKEYRKVKRLTRKARFDRCINESVKTKHIIIASVIIFILSLFTLSLDNRKLHSGQVDYYGIIERVHTYGVSIDTTMRQFMDAIAVIESSGCYLARRPNSQYLGRYQIGNAAREDIGLKGFNNKEGYNTFLNNPELQDIAMVMLTKHNYLTLRPYIKKYENKLVGGYYLTESGIIAMAHACGANGVIQFLNSNGSYIPRDGNNKKATDYLQLNNFNLKL